MPEIEIKIITKDMRFVMIDGVKAGSLHCAWENVFQGFNKWKKEKFWTGDFDFGGEHCHVGATDKVSRLKDKVEQLVRGVLIRQGEV